MNRVERDDLPTYVHVTRNARIGGHHGGRTVVYTSDGDDPLLEAGYYVVDAESEETLTFFPENCSAGWAYGYAEAVDDERET